MTAGKTRWLFGLESVAMMVLAVVACVLLITAADTKYERFDLTRDGRNTLAPEIAERISKLPEKVEVDVFFRPLQGVFDLPAAEVRGRMLELLFHAQNARRDLFEVTVHDLSDVATVRARQQELGVESARVVVFSSGARRAAFDLFEEISDIDWGNPTLEGIAYLTEEGLADAIDPRSWNPDPAALRPPFLARFRGEEVLATGLAKVTQGEPPLVRFVTGYGESGIDSNDDRGLLRLRRVLESDGFRVETWDAAANPRVPEDTDVLAVVGPTQPLDAEVRESIEAWVAETGRLFIAPALEEALAPIDGGATTLAQRFGMPLERGLVCQPFVDRHGISGTGDQRCATLVVGEVGLDASNRITAPIRMRGARMRFHLAPAFRPRPHPGGSLALPIVSSSGDSWLDLPNAAGAPNFRRESNEVKKRWPLAMFAEWGRKQGAEEGQIASSMVVGVASSIVASNASFDANRDFLLNAFNALAARDFRIGVNPTERRVEIFDLRSGNSLSVLSKLVGLGLPLAFSLVGAFIAWRRRS